MQEPKTRATPVFRFGTAKLQFQKETKITTGKDALPQNQKASKEEEETKERPLNKKVKRRQRKIISQSNLRQKELKEAQLRRNQNKQI